MIIVRKMKNGFRCDMCFAKPEYEISGDDRYAELPAFTLHLCKGHAEQLAKSITDALAVEKGWPKEMRPTKKRKYYRKCGICGERHEQSEMIRTYESPNGWICVSCHMIERPELYMNDDDGIL